VALSSLSHRDATSMTNCACVCARLEQDVDQERWKATSMKEDGVSSEGPNDSVVRCRSKDQMRITSLLSTAHAHPRSPEVAGAIFC